MAHRCVDSWLAKKKKIGSWNIQRRRRRRLLSSSSSSSGFSEIFAVQERDYIYIYIHVHVCIFG